MSSEQPAAGVNRRELADRLDSASKKIPGSGCWIVRDGDLKDVLRLLREPVAGEVLEALEKVFAHTGEMATAHIMRARVQSVILRARLDDEGKGGEHDRGER